MKTYNLLFLCTGNSARSILGEAIVNHLCSDGGRFRGYSAGSQPKGAVHPLSLALLAERGIPTDGLRSKSWDEYAVPGAPQMDFIFTVCDQAAGEACPYWPGQPMTAHWGLPDPASVVGEDAARRAFRDTFTALRRRIDLLTALPLEQLDKLVLESRLRDIGRN